MRIPLLLLLASAVLASGRVERHPWSGAIEVRNRAFVVETNTYPEIARALAATLEASYAFYQDRFGPLQGRARRPMRVALFRNRDEYLRHGEGVRGAVGHFDAALDRCALAWSGAVGETGWPIAVHEAGHHYFRRRHPGLSLPSWYTEGVACLFEGLQDPTSGGIARMRARTAKAAAEAGDAHLALVLNTRACVREGRLELTNYPPSRFYALAWSLLHMLATRPGYRENFRRFELRLFASRPPQGEREALARRLLEEECGSLPAIERDWREHLRDLPDLEAPRAAPVYEWELFSANPFVRYAAIRRLPGGRLPEELRAALRSCLRDEDVIVRTAACEAMARRMDRDAVPAMTSALDAGDKKLKSVALEALAHRKATGAVPRLLGERERREAALEALAVIRDPRSFGALRDATLDRILPARLRARCAAALRADPGATAVLRVAATDPEPSVRTAARAALIARGEATGGGKTRERPDATETMVLVEVLRTPTESDDRKAWACRMLAAVGAKEAVSALRRLCLPRVGDRVRLEAVRALVRITGETRGFADGQPARARETAYRAWALH